MKTKDKNTLTLHTLNQITNNSWFGSIANYVRSQYALWVCINYSGSARIIHEISVTKCKNSLMKICKFYNKMDVSIQFYFIISRKELGQ